MWLYNKQVFTQEDIPEKAVGFVYCITNLLTSKKYIGKKQFSFSRKTTKTVTLKNGTKKKKAVRQVNISDWDTYYGSSDALKADVEAMGETAFVRQILHICYSKAECSYLEAYEIFNRHALLSDKYYNSWMSVRVTKKHVFGKIDKNILPR